MVNILIGLYLVLAIGWVIGYLAHDWVSMLREDRVADRAARELDGLLAEMARRGGGRFEV